MDLDYLEDEQGYGLVTFAGVMLLIVATLNVLWGIAAIDKANVFTQHARYVFGDLSTFGWIVLALGILQAFAAFAIWRGTSWARWFGVACASGNATGVYSHATAGAVPKRSAIIVPYSSARGS
jgi:uncharacterized membrane protein (DUF2068 family)